MFAYLKILVLNGVVLVALNLLTVELLVPFLDRQIGNLSVSRIIATVVSLIAAAPFLWAIIGKRPEKVVYKEWWLEEKYGMTPMLVLKIIRLAIGILITGLWIDTIYTGIGMIIALPVSIILLAVFYKKNSKVLLQD